MTRISLDAVMNNVDEEQIAQETDQDWGFNISSNLY